MIAQPSCQLIPFLLFTFWILAGCSSRWNKPVKHILSLSTTAIQLVLQQMFWLVQNYTNYSLASQKKNLVKSKLIFLKNKTTTQQHYGNRYYLFSLGITSSHIVDSKSAFDLASCRVGRHHRVNLRKWFCSCMDIHQPSLSDNGWSVQACEQMGMRSKKKALNGLVLYLTNIC